MLEHFRFPCWQLSNTTAVDRAHAGRSEVAVNNDPFRFLILTNLEFPRLNVLQSRALVISWSAGPLRLRTPRILTDDETTGHGN